MIDFEIHQRLHGKPLVATDYKATRNKQTDPWSISISHSQEPKEDDFLMMPPKIFGYDFFEKEWVSLSVSNIKPIKWNKQPYEDLVLPEATKHLVKAMVTIRASSIKKTGEHANFDIISGKGNGLIMLFHGSPGTGKTLTAESVAEIAEMPLYPITCGDIGTEPDKVEQYLQLVFQLGKRWNCVLLLDEADVFLEERTLTDLQRNSLVSVFLRMLEYYEGILILTSNRVGTFDDAFRSRIHIALHYEDLKPRSRKKIWSNFLTRLEDTEEGENVGEIKDRLDELAKHNLNGREIRNALSTARQLASHGGEKMNWEHLELAIKTANDFGSYLRDVHGHSDREWAREARTR
jgi:SpoVK/Ycf46/Vps4 family AAA+-type ATPase